MCFILTERIPGRHLYHQRCGPGAALRLKLSRSTGARCTHEVRTKGNAEPAPQGPPRGKGKLAPNQTFLREYSQENKLSLGINFSPAIKGLRTAASKPYRITLRTHSERPLSAHSVEELTFANAEIAVPNPARAPFLPCFARLLQRRKDLCQFPEVLGGCGEQKFIICAAWTT